MVVVVALPSAPSPSPPFLSPSAFLSAVISTSSTISTSFTASFSTSATTSTSTSTLFSTSTFIPTLSLTSALEEHSTSALKLSNFNKVLISFGDPPEDRNFSSSMTLETPTDMV